MQPPLGKAGADMCNIYVYLLGLISIVRQRSPGVQIRHVQQRRRAPPIAMCVCAHERVRVYNVQRVWLGLLPMVLCRAWILQDLCRTERRGYGVGGNERAAKMVKL